MTRSSAESGSRDPTRRRLLAGGAALFGTAALHTANAVAAETRLRDAAAVGRIVFGAAGGSELFKDAAYRDLVIEQAALLTPENALKFDALRPAIDRFDFDAADALVDGARRAGLAVHGHTLFWNDWPPDWLKGLSGREIEHVFETHLATVVPHFAGRLVSWDVVNEPFWLGADKPGTFRPGPWYDALGEDYIFRAFRRTAELDPAAKLVLNEAWTERSDPIGLAVRRSLIGEIDRLRDRGVRIDAIGLQAHLTPSISYDDMGFVEFLHEIGERGLEIYLSELDVDDESFPGSDEARDAAVAARTKAFLQASLSVPAVTRVVTWGLSDRYTWWREPSTMVAHHLTRLARPLPYDDELVRKPMWFAMADAFRRRDSARR